MCMLTRLFVAELVVVLLGCAYTGDSSDVFGVLSYLRSRRWTLL